MTCNVSYFLQETRVAHVISIGSEMATNLNEEFENNFSDLVRLLCHFKGFK